MKHLLEYDEADLRDLLGDLEKVGQAEERAFSIWLFVLEFHDDYGNKRSVFLPVAEGTFWTTGDLKEDKTLIYNKLKAGDFETRKVDYSEDTLAQKPLLRILSNSSLKSFFESSTFRNPLSRGLNGLLYDLKNMTTKVQNTIYPGRGDVQMNRLGVVLFYGSEKDIESLTTNQMAEFGLPKMLGDSYAPGALTVDFTKMKGRRPQIRPS